MAVEYVDAVLRGLFGVTPTTKLVAVVLAEHAGRGSGGVSWPSIDTIACLAGIDPRNVRRHIAILVEAGWILPISSRKGGRAKSTHYRLNVETMRAEMKKRGRPCPGLAHGNPDASVLVSGAKTRTPASINPDAVSRN